MRPFLPRLSSALLTLAVVAVAVVVAPVASLPEPAPEPVPVRIHSVDLAPVLTPQATPAGPRTVAATGERETEPFEALGVTWAPDPQVGEVVVRARTRTHGDWTPWIEVDQEVRTGTGETHEDGPGVRGGTEPAWVGDSDGVDVVVQSLSGRAPTDLRLDLVDPGESPADAGPAPGPGGSVAHAAADRPAIRSRAEWGADEGMRGDGPSYSSTVEAVVLHHTASSNAYAPGDVPGILRSFYAFHVQSRGWSDIGYNVLVDKFGTAWEGRWGGLDKAVIGAHAGGFNTDTVGISMIGTFDGVDPPAAMAETVARVAAWKLSLYSRDPHGRVTLTSRGSTRYPEGTRVDLPRIFGHRDVSTTACPGPNGYALLPRLRDRTRELTPPAPPPSPFGELEAVVGEKLGVRVAGWVVDPDGGAGSDVVVTVDGAEAARFRAGDRRQDVWDAHPPYGPSHGFSQLVPAAPGSHQVCVTALNRGGGSDLPLGCRAAVVPVAPPLPTIRDAERACPATVPPAGFVDTLDSAHARAIDCAVWWEVATGVTRTSYAPTRTVTRAQMASFLARLVVESGGELPDDAPAAFDDVDPTSVHAPAIDRLAAADIVRGRAERAFAPDAVVTRDQMATFLVAVAEARRGEALPAGEDYFHDDDGNPHEASIGKVARAGVTGGVGPGRYGPERASERGQMASFLTRVLDLLVDGGTTRARA